MATILNLARWIAWQLGEAEHPPPANQPARITVFSTNEPA
jgi:hypothetical protein